MRRRTVGLTILLVGLVARPLTAQAPRQALSAQVEVAGAYATLQGDDFEFTDAGIGFELLGVLDWGGPFALAAGLQRTTHNLEGLNDNLAALQILAEPRWRIGTANPGLSPYLFGRVGFVRASAELEGLDTSQSGFSVGGGVGMLIGRRSTVRFTAGVGFHYVSLGDIEADGQTIGDTDASGTALTLRAGVSIGFGGGGRSPRR